MPGRPLSGRPLGGRPLDGRPLAFNDGNHIASGKGVGESLFSYAALFVASEPGVWYDPSDLSTLFQDSAGTTPVTAAGQPVGRILDKSGRGFHATQTTAAARPIYQTDGALHWLAFDGVDDFLVTPTITPGVDKVQIFAGVRKLSDTVGIVAELSANAAGNAAFYLVAGTDAAAQYSSLGRGDSGTATSQIAKITGFFAPDLAVLTALHDIPAPLSRLRRNGVTGTDSTATKGTGNFLAHPMYIGRRNGTAIPFNGNLYGLVARFGPNLTPEQIAQAETAMAAKTGVTL